MRKTLGMDFAIKKDIMTHFGHELGLWKDLYALGDASGMDIAYVLSRALRSGAIHTETE